MKSTNMNLAVDKQLKQYTLESGNFVLFRSRTWRCSRLENLARLINLQRNRIQAELASEQLFEFYFMQHSNLLLSCETQYLKLINLELYQVLEPMWRDQMYCQFVIVVVVLKAGMNLIFKILCTIIIDK